MSCPHVSAVIALLKSIHPDWSSAAIRSALMTTSTINNVVGKPITNATGDDANSFEYGAGHFRPSRAVDPGLIYDATYNDYLLYLCSQNISLDSSFNCPEKVPEASNLNYPSLAIANINGSSRTVRRVVTNVGKGNSTYVLAVRSPPGYVVDIVPKMLQFSKLGEKRSFNIIVRAESSVERRNEFAFGWYKWSDGVHVVRSPIAEIKEIDGVPGMGMKKMREAMLKKRRGVAEMGEATEEVESQRGEVMGSGRDNLRCLVVTWWQILSNPKYTLMCDVENNLTLLESLILVPEFLRCLCTGVAALTKVSRWYRDSMVERRGPNFFCLASVAALKHCRSILHRWRRDPNNGRRGPHL
ncbi:hypothetical protein RND71_020217 [Anisodus tanguticus]|uniref:Uncharacterized protein n=1 Tax=Anisodus tanguticus TaxID=243964 RepID=A0AAE1S0L6_9SOLA|nr:hypothetical protein RND71_020217 [Anisodus tanguticus]